jgi:O-antigen/teichoic acid export membrane protein
MAPVMLMLVGALPLLLLRDHIRSVCSAHFRYHVSFLIDASVSMVQLSAIGLLAWLGKLSIPAAFVCLGVACLFPLATWLVRPSQPYRIRRDRLRADWSLSWNYSRWLVLARVVAIGGSSLVPWIVVYYLGIDAAGSFAACTNLVGLSLMFITGMNNYFQPRSVRAFHDGGGGALTRSVVESIAIFTSALGMISLAFYFAGDWLLGRIYGTDFGQFGMVSFYLSLSMLTVCVSIASGNGLAALGKPRGYFWGEFSYCCVSVGLSFCLIPRYGLVGASWALVGGGVAASVVTSWTLVRLMQTETDRVRVGPVHRGET